jgi:diguanylate cyclase (GGDEF)-like protein/PAS domain S-box-containing protein
MLAESEVERSVAGQLLMLELRVSRILAGDDDETIALFEVLRAVCETLGWTCGRYWQVDEVAKCLRVAVCWAPPGADIAHYLARSQLTTLPPGAGIEGRAWMAQQMLWVTDSKREAYPDLDSWAGEAGLRGVCVLPLAYGGVVVGVLAFASLTMPQPEEQLEQTLSRIGDHVGRFLQRKRRDEDLLRFRAALDISADSIWLIDRDTLRFIDVNATACERFGYSREELLTMGPCDLSPEQSAYFATDYDQIIAGDTAPIISERMLRHKDGTLIPVEARRCAVESGGRWIIVGISRDISDQVAADKALRESDESFRLLAESMPQIAWVCEPDGSCTYMNRRWVDDTGLPIEHSYGHGWLDVIHPEDHQGCLASWQRSLDTGIPYEDEFRVRRANGSYRWMLSRGLAMRDGNVNILKWFGTWTDIDYQKRAEQTIRLHAMQQNLIAAFGHKALASSELANLLHEIVTVTVAGLDVELCGLLKLDTKGRSFTFEATAGWQSDLIPERIADIDVTGDTQNRYVRAASESVIIIESLDEPGILPVDILAAHDVSTGIEVPIVSVNGVYGVLGAYSREPRTFTETEINFLQSLVNTLATAINRKDAEQRLTHLAQYDALTDLPNRRLFLDRVTQTLTQAQRSRRLVAILFADLDRFKAVNDTLGHGLGDQLLVQAAQRLLGCTRTSDVVARLGGDEFALMLSNLASVDDAMLVAQKIVDALAAPFDLDGHEAFISVSLGISLYPDDGDNAEALLKNADTAMYQAKESGRDHYRFYLPQMNEHAAIRMSMEAQLRGALERQEFSVYYQPKVNLASGAISGFEALLRWRHPQHGLMEAEEFMPILEDTGLVVPVGEWVIRQVCAQLRAWAQQGISLRPIAVNLSPRQFQARDLDETIAAIMRDFAIDPGLLEFELTESMLMGDTAATVLMLGKLQTLGVKVSIDDFGTGYSSLAYLKRFPLDALKIDCAFIRDIATDLDDRAIACAIINLAHSLDLKVVAEGVESEAQLDFLRAHACDEVQGNYLAPPTTERDCPQILHDGRLPGRSGAV